MTELVRYDAMCRAIDAAYQVDEVKDIRDKARAWEVYSQQARNVEAERRACKIRLRAERKAGQLLRDMGKAKPPGDNQYMRNLDRCHEGTEAKTLNDLGISKRQSANWQKLANIPDDEFEVRLVEAKKPTTRGFVDFPKPEEPNIIDAATATILGLEKAFCDHYQLCTLLQSVRGELQRLKIMQNAKPAPSKQKSGVEFLDEDGGGPGVRLRKSLGGSIPVEELNSSNDD